MHRRHTRVLAAVIIGTLAVTGLTGCGKKKGRGGAFGDHGGSVTSGAEGVAPSGVPTDVPSGFPTDLDLPSGYPSSAPSYGGSDTPTPAYTTDTPSYSPSPTYNPDAINESTASNCDYDESDSMLVYDITVTNTDSTRSFRYSLNVKWTKKDDGSFMGSDTQYVTVLPNSSQTVTAKAVHRLDTYTYFNCQLTSATKSPVG